jgi:AraC-like DNA-binding protein
MVDRRMDSWLLRSRATARCDLGAVVQAGVLDKRQPWESFGERFRVDGRYACVLLIEGHGRFQDDHARDRVVEPGDMLLLLPDVGHRYGPEAGAHWRELYVVFDGPVFNQWYDGGLLDAARPIVHVAPVDRWQARLGQVVDPNATTALDAAAEVCRMQHLLAEALRSRTTNAAAPWAKQAERLIESTIPGPVDWAAIADAMHVSVSTFRRRFVEHFGMPPGRYRNRLLIDHACSLMHRTDLPDKQIALELGFCDPHYFSRCFKQILNQSPRQYRQSLP